MRHNIHVLHCPNCGQPFRYDVDTPGAQQTGTCNRCGYTHTINVTMYGNVIGSVTINAQANRNERLFRTSAVNDVSFADVEMRALILRNRRNKE